MVSVASRQGQKEVVKVYRPTVEEAKARLLEAAAAPARTPALSFVREKPAQAALIALAAGALFITMPKSRKLLGAAALLAAKRFM